MHNDSSGRIAERLAEEVEALPPGARLPSQRALVRRFGASATTVAHALATLAQRGLVESRPGAGTFRAASGTPAAAGDTAWQTAALELTGRVDGVGHRVVDSAALRSIMAVPTPDVVDLSGGYLHPDLQPRALLTSALSRSARSSDAWARSPADGLAALRDWFAADIGAGLSRHDVVVCGGGQAALATLMRALAQPGDPVVVEAPTYPGTIAAAQAAGLRPVPVPVDGQGMRTDHLEEALTHSAARVVVLQPLFQNPTGACLPPARRADLLDLARRHGCFVVEDDFARHLVHRDAAPQQPPLVADDPDGHVVHIRSLTKVTSQHLRVAAVAARGPAMGRIRSAFLTDTMTVPAPLQLTALEVVSAPGWRKALSRLGAELETRRSVAVEAVLRTFGAAGLPLVPVGGYHLWVRLPSHLDGRQVAAAALAHGIAVSPDASYYPTDNTVPHIRVSYVATPSTADLAAGIRRLGPVLDEA